MLEALAQKTEHPGVEESCRKTHPGGVGQRGWEHTEKARVPAEGKGSAWR